MKKVYILACILILTFFLTYPVFAGNDPPIEGCMLPQITLMVPENPDHQKYLGVTGKSIFILTGIKADVVIIEIFSIYCPHCQKDAPEVNELYRKIENNKNLKDLK